MGRLISSVKLHLTPLEGFHEDRTGPTLVKNLAIATFIDRSHSRALERVESSGRAGEAAIAGDPPAVRDQYEELREMGFDLIVTFFEDFQDLSAMKLFMDEVVPEFS